MVSETPEATTSESLSNLRYPWELPEFNKISKFFSALKKSRIETVKCKNCGQLQWPPRAICNICLSNELEWVEVSRQGRLIAFSNAYVGLNENETPPILVGAVHLDDGLRLLTRITNSKYEDLKVGMRVELVTAGLVKGKPFWAHSLLRN
jgi:uncharacterized protein